MSGLLESERSHRQRATHQAAELQELQQQARCGNQWCAPGLVDHHAEA